MGTPILLIGKSGTGKSSSLRNFRHGEAAVINVLGKPLPFKTDIKTYDTADYAKVKYAITKAPQNAVIIDDAGYLITSMFMQEHANTGAGNAVFALYNKIGDEFWKLIRFVSETLPPEKLVYFIMHEDKNDFGDVKPKTIGKILDEKVCVEGMFSIVLRSARENGEYIFRTQSTGLDVTKTPMGMFGQETIPNDLKAVDGIIREYYGLQKGKGDSNAKTE